MKEGNTTMKHLSTFESYKPENEKTWNINVHSQADTEGIPANHALDVLKKLGKNQVMTVSNGETTWRYRDRMRWEEVN